MKHTTPTMRLALGLAVVAALALISIFLPALDLVRNIAAAALAIGVLLDAMLVSLPPQLKIERAVQHNIPVGVWSTVTLKLRNHSRRHWSIDVHDHHPAHFDMDGQPQALALNSQTQADLHYRIRPRRRGDGHFPGLDLILHSPFGFWLRRRYIELPNDTQVYPNFREISRFALLATDNQLSQMGIKRRQRRGEGNDFHQLREYRAGDNLRQIDWKATSRYRKLISKEYQDERDQQILFLLDCGRRMRHEEDDGVHLDQALNAMLLSAYVAANQGDAVGFMSFGGDKRWYPPRKGGHVVRTLLSNTYDLQSSLAAADYLSVAKEILSLQQRRALIVLITNTRNEDHDDLIAAVRLLSRRHLVVLADLREQILDESLKQPVEGMDEALRFQGVTEYLENRRRNHEALGHHGALTLDLLAPQLPVALVNEYLMIKASGRL